MLQQYFKIQALKELNDLGGFFECIRKDFKFPIYREQLVYTWKINELNIL